MEQNRGLLFACLIWVLISCNSKETLFTLVNPTDSGIGFNNTLNPTAELNILTYLYYYNGGGVAITDFNNDGLDDIYLVCNQCADKLYLNQGNFNFKDITKISGIDNTTGWTSGVTHVDINNDGLKDIYLSKVGRYKSIQGRNKLYINQGLDEQGVPIFKEQAADFGLDLIGFSTQSTFFDYDLDGDLDMFQLSHSVYPNRSYGNGDSRSVRDSLAQDRLMENVDGKYVDVSGKAQIFQGKIGYGLGVSISDVDNNGYPDIYVGNDFFENDYLYLNNGDKTFTEVISKDHRLLGHTTHYSMGNTIVDVNNDGLTDIISLDMLPQDLVTLKSSGEEDPFPVYERFLKNNYAPQYMQNTLHINRGNQSWSEVGYQSGIAATEWSWGVLGQDFNMDGYKDLFITNGIVGATNDLDYINFIVQDQIQKDIEFGVGNDILSFTSKMPKKHVPNFIYQNNGNNTFRDATADWIGIRPSFSNGSATGDLDNDGDLDLVVNNVNEPAFILKNNAIESGEKNYVKIQFQGSADNKYGIGAKVTLYANDLSIYHENFPTQSYLSTSVDYLVIGLGSNQKVDSITVQWPDGGYQLLKNIKANTSIVLKQADASVKTGFVVKTKANLLSNSFITLPFFHQEQSSLDFDHDPLVPFAMSHEGPDIEVGDVNRDGTEDIFITGAKMQESALFLQNEQGEFQINKLPGEDNFKINEDVASLFFDANGDGNLDLLIASGGNEFASGKPLEPRLYLNNGEGNFINQPDAFKGVNINASVIQTLDLENDGDNDIVIAADVVPRKFGETPASYIFKNRGDGTFRDVSKEYGQFRKSGNITDVAIHDIDNNGFQDLIVVGDWMPVSIYLNDGKKLDLNIVPNSEGWWNCVEVFDFDNDGDMDIVGGNWGLNSRLTASRDQPVRLYRYDFDQNGTGETILTYFYQGKETMLATRDELARQLPEIKKRYLSYTEFAKATVQDILPKLNLPEVRTKKVVTLETTVFRNDGNLSFTPVPLPFDAQVSTVNDLVADDIDGDGYMDLILVGNNYEVNTQLARKDASHGLLLLNNRNGSFESIFSKDFRILGPARDIEPIKIAGKNYFIVGINNDQPIFIEKLISHE